MFSKDLKSSIMRPLVIMILLLGILHALPVKAAPSMLTGDKPVVGDWDNDGDTTIGVYRGNRFLLRNSNTNGFAEISLYLGNTGDTPIAGNWDGIPSNKIGEK